ncbi:MAG: ATP-binding protein [Eubacterium sp.]|jgi:hypothetical protein|nr:ATP-binding protein [Eubacterium sp.]
MSVEAYENDLQLLCDYQALFISLMGADTSEFSQAKDRWDRIQIKINLSAISFATERVRERFSLCDSEYLCLILAIVYEMGNLSREEVTFYHGAVMSGIIFGQAADISSLFIRNSSFSLLWRQAREGSRMTDPLLLRPNVLMYFITGILYTSPDRCVYLPKTSEFCNPDAAAEMHTLLEQSALVLHGSSEDGKARLVLFSNRYQRTAYCISSREADYEDCVILAALADYILYFDSPSEDAMRSILYWRAPLGLTVIVRCEGNQYRLPQIEMGRTRRISLSDMHGSELREQLRTLCNYAAQGREAFEHYGLSDGMYYGTGVCAIFYGKSGTGKTMAAHAVANELKKPMISVSLAEIFDKYIGETEKKLERLFLQAETQDAVLFFDEAETLFSKRASVSSSLDKYSNLSTSYLLKRVEGYGGIVLLSTNLVQNIDEAFLRRMQFVIRFPMPSRNERSRYWETFFTESLIAELGELINKELSYAAIKEIVKMSAVLARCENNERIPPETIQRAYEMEMSKIV